MGLLHTVAETTPKTAESERRFGELIGRVAQADQDALARLYDVTSPLVFGLVLKIVGERSTAEEVTLDVYTQVWKKASSFDSQRGTLLSWMLAISRSRAIDRLRSRPHRDRQREHAIDEVVEIPHDSPTPEESSTASDQRRLVRQALESIHPEQRQAIEMAYYFGLTHSEIAERLQQPLGTVKTRIRLGMLRLRQVLTPYKEAI